MLGFEAGAASTHLIRGRSLQSLRGSHLIHQAQANESPQPLIRTGDTSTGSNAMGNATAAKASRITPRFIRFMDAPGYLGMCRDEFNKTVRPNVREFPIGKQGIAFDRIELDEWADAYVESNSIEKRQPAHTATVKHSSSNEPSPVVLGRSRTLIDPHANSKEEFERVLAMVTGKPRAKK
jgi:predicted DNA-binding transcriptional regulator AlpA